MVLTKQVMIISQVPFPPGATAGEDNSSDEVPAAELHGGSFTSSFSCCSQGSQQGQQQQHAPHPLRLCSQQEGSTRVR